MLQILLILTLLACVLLVAIVMIQNPKGGGLASNFSASSQLMGVKKTGDFLEKGTWGLAIFLMVISLVINVAVKGGSAASNGTRRDDPSKNIKATSQPVAPNLAPQATPGATGTQPAVTPSKPGTGKK